MSNINQSQIASTYRMRLSGIVLLKSVQQPGNRGTTRLPFDRNTIRPPVGSGGSFGDQCASRRSDLEVFVPEFPGAHQSRLQMDFGGDCTPLT